MSVRKLWPAKWTGDSPERCPVRGSMSTICTCSFPPPHPHPRSMATRERAKRAQFRRSEWVMAGYLLNGRPIERSSGREGATRADDVGGKICEGGKCGQGVRCLFLDSERLIFGHLYLTTRPIPSSGASPR